MTQQTFKHLFGPVPSRRLGRSLGIDLTPFKTCSFDCIFCQLGRTTVKTCERREGIAVQEVLTELAAWFDSGATADYITLAGSGEPTLNAGFGQVIDFVHNASRIPVALLTNGSLFSDPEVRTQAAKANLVKVSLSVWDQASLELVNRPAEGIVFEQMLAGQQAFREQFNGELWVEVFLLPDLNTSPEQITRIAALVKSLKPDKVQLNTAVRPPCEGYVQPVPEKILHDLAGHFTPKAEVIAEFSSDSSAQIKATESDVLATLERRPCTVNQLCAVFSLHRNEAAKYIGKLLRTGKISERRKDGEVYFEGLHANDR
ncbi:MAG: radical SAM protein [Lentisphaeria bacterium]